MMCRFLLRAMIAPIMVFSCTVFAQVAHFENFTEGESFPTFVDPVSGIEFTAPTGPVPLFTIEAGDVDPNSPIIAPNGNVLSAGGYVPGPGVALPFEFGFTGILPLEANQLSMAIGYGSVDGSPQLLLEGLNASGDVVASSTFVPLVGQLFLEATIAIQSPAIDIHSFRLVPTDLFVVYDNIEFVVPEPGSSVASFLACAGLLLRRTSRENSMVGRARRGITSATV